MSSLRSIGVAALFGTMAGTAYAAEPCPSFEVDGLYAGDSRTRYMPKGSVMPGFENILGPECQNLTYRKNSTTGVFELLPNIAANAPAHISRTYTPPALPLAPSQDSDRWFNKKDYLPEKAAPFTAKYIPTEKSIATKDSSFGQCVLSNGLTVAGRGSVILDNRTIYSAHTQPGSDTCQFLPALRVHVIDTPQKTSGISSDFGFQQASYRINDNYPQPQFYRTAAAPIVVVGAYATGLMLVTALHYLNPMLAYDVADPQRKLAVQHPQGVVLHPAVTAGIDAQRRFLGLQSEEAVNIFLGLKGNLLGPSKLFEFFGILPNTQARPSAEFCRQAEEVCHDRCEEYIGQPGIGGRLSQGIPYTNCRNQCLESMGCK